MIVINHIFECYLLFCIAIVTHELSHYLAAKVIHIPVHKICIGERLFAITVGRWSISPLMLYGSGVVVPEDVLQTKNRLQKVIFFLAGIVGNVFTAIAGLILMRYQAMYGNFLLWESVVLILTSAFPFGLTQSDMYNLRRYLRLTSDRSI